ncbi:telomeric repeat-binding factor 2-interacting protein 1 [Dendropsophus ebraccatus]|uniref:telomeric repeat-binding factor 2-interacting protein 1 n=1 Tax=Dendropsophus ebraccatus TaxID=150705 RepID=UPI0038317ED6
MAALELFSHSSSLFITDLGPMRFYVRPGPLKRQLSPLITHGGGIMCRVQEPGAFLLAEPGQAQGIQYMSSTYITDCVRSNRRLSPRKYRLLSRGIAGPVRTCIRAGAPVRMHRVETKNRSPEGGTSVSCDQSPDPGGEGATSVSCDQIPDPGGEGAISVSCDQSPDPGGEGATSVSCDQSPDPGGEGATSVSCDQSPDPGGEGATSVSCDQSPDPGGEGATSVSCDQSPDPGSVHTPLDSNPAGSRSAPDYDSSISAAPPSCDPITADPGHSAEAITLCDPSAFSGSPALCGPRPSLEAPDPHDPGLSTKDSALCNPSPHAPVSCDLGPANKSSVTKDKPGADNELMAESGRSQVQITGVNPIVMQTTNETGTENGGGHSAVEDNQCQAVPGQSSPLHVTPGAVGRLPFSRQEDITILLYVQENKTPKRSVSGTLLWKELEKKQLLRRTWQAMKSRYTKYIVQHKHRYRLSPKELAQATSKIVPIESPVDDSDQHREPSSVDTTKDLIPQPQDLSTVEKSPNSPHEDPPAAASLVVGNTREGACTDLNTYDNDNSEGEGHSDESKVIRRLRNANRRIVTELALKPMEENGESTAEGEEGSRVFMATSKLPPTPQENRDTESSEDLQIFEIANMEFEVEDEDSGRRVKAPGISLKDFVMGEDSVSVDTQMQVDDVNSSPDLSDTEGLQVALTDMMSEFKLDICQVTQALLKNNGEVGSTRHFLRVGRRPDGFPIWEHEDDVDLQKNDPMVQAQLARKYGADNVAKRAAFLAS